MTEIRLLGTSGAWPIPRVGCACPQCDESRREPRLRRTRSSLWLRSRGEVLLVDPGPDVFHQFERERLDPRVDRVLVTHTHVDHCWGLDDLVHLRQRPRGALTLGASPPHVRRLREVFPHLHREPLPDVVSVDWSPGTRLAVGEVLLEGFETGHRKDMPTVAVLLTVPVGGRTRRIAYATDMGEVPAASRDLLRGVDLLLGDGSTIGTGDAWHPGTDAVARLASEVGARRLAFTHVGHVRLADADLRARLAPAALARDGDDLLALLPA